MPVSSVRRASGPPGSAAARVLTERATAAFRVLDAARPGDAAVWEALWRGWPGREVMAHPEYLRLFARGCDRVVCFVGQGEGWTVLLPLLLRPLRAEPWARPGEERWDAASPYGYGGPFTWGEGARADATFWARYAAWCRQERVISTMLRLSVVPGQLAPVPPVVTVRQQNVVCALEGGAEAVWARYRPSARNNVRHARRAGVRVEVDETGAGLDAFLDVYLDTMRRRAAEPWYYLPRAFFEQLVARLPGQFAFFQARLGGEVVSCELVLRSSENVYAFLGGTRAEHFAARPNDLLRHEVAAWAAGQGKLRYVLGGGYRGGDGVYRHKLAFAPRGVVPFRVACLVHDAQACEEQVRARQALAAAAGQSWAPRQGYCPPYRG